MSQCENCGLSKSRNRTVPGEGNYDAQVMMIGEAPGSNEDKTGRPFAGRAGNLLNELLDSVSIKRSQIYITNTLKCRPPSNRDPQQTEINSCEPYLALQISLINPSIIITLGRFSFSKFFPNITLSKARGIVREWNGIKILPMYHPAAALYNPSLKPKLLQDFQQIPSLINISSPSISDQPQKYPATQVSLFGDPFE
ncbi:MAG: DNA polymerase [Chloroflexi bacterium]|nr:MAG: DNA polymerase [Chloroflexota bacterium]